MKKAMILPAMLAVMSLFSCSDKEENDVIGGRECPKFDKTVMEIPTVGGSDTVYITNDRKVFITDVKLYMDGELIEIVEPTIKYLSYKGEGYHIYVPDECNMLIADVDSTMNGKDYEIQITMRHHVLSFGPFRVIPKR
jgi:hypothetical protein